MSFVSLLFSLPAAGQTDSAGSKPGQTAAIGRQLRIGVDISKPVMNLLQSGRNSYEASVDYYLRKEVYAVVEGGWGSAVYEYPDLSYRSTNSFLRAGLDKTLIKRLNASDWDAAFIGLRYGIGFIDRKEASYTIVDSLWGSSTGTIPAQTVTAHWAEITGGVRVELLPRFMAGWNVRARFLLNDKAFGELKPVYIAGFGQGDRTTVFDFNFYLCYVLRWGTR